MPSRRVSGWPIFEPCRWWAGAGLRRMSGVMQRSGMNRERGSGQSGDALGRAGSSQVERAHQDALRELDLERVVAGRRCGGERSLRGMAEILRGRLAACENSLGVTRAPGLCGNAAERNACLLDPAAHDRKMR